jgi:hypothetical protein
MRFFDLGFPVAHRKFMSLQYEDYIYKFIVDACAAPRSGKKKHSQQYQEYLLIHYLTLYACVDHGTYYKFYFKKKQYCTFILY